MQLAAEVAGLLVVGALVEAVDHWFVGVQAERSFSKVEVLTVVEEGLLSVEDLAEAIGVLVVGVLPCGSPG